MVASTPYVEYSKALHPGVTMEQAALGFRRLAQAMKNDKA